MSNPNEPLKVDPTELRLTADQLDGQASGFRTAHETAHSRAGGVALGSSQAAAALPGMLAAWEADGTRFEKHFATCAQRHRAAADKYASTDSDNAGGIDAAGSVL